jgi:hypothetical protein
VGSGPRPRLSAKGWVARLRRLPPSVTEMGLAGQDGRRGLSCPWVPFRESCHLTRPR